MKIARSAVVVLALVTTACGSSNTDKQMFALAGAAVGALAGGWAGSNLGGGTGKLIYTLGGALIGGVAGYDSGRSLVAEDRPDYYNAISQALGGGENRAVWENTKTGNGGYVSAGQSYRDGNGIYCRQFRATVAFEDEVLNGPGSACRNAHGDWELVADAFH